MTTKNNTKEVTRAEAEKSADEWMPYIRECLVSAIQDPRQHRDIGKLLAGAAEILMNKFLSEKSGRHVETIIGEPYDGCTHDELPVVRSQNKFRMGDWHFETTRRNSKKNADTNDTGHVAYRTGEFDLVAFFKPGPAFGITGSTIRCVPENALIDPEKPHKLVTRIKKNIQREYDSDIKTEEVIQRLYRGTLSQPPG
jgi:hypothetical protein